MRLREKNLVLFCLAIGFGFAAIYFAIALYTIATVVAIFIGFALHSYCVWSIDGAAKTRVAELKASLHDVSAKHAEQERMLGQVRGKAAIAQSTQMLAHDIRKPFSLIKMALDQLAREKDPIAMRDIVRRFVPAVEKALDAADRMIADVMDFGHETDLQLETIAPDALVESTVNSLFRIKKDSNIALSYDFQHSYKVRADSLKVLRVLQNIVENANDVLAGSGTIWFATKDFITDKGRFIHFEVGNDGDPIPEERLARLFEPFFTKGKKGGTGLGLSIALKIIDAHGGSIWCESSRDRGTRFYFTLPAAKQRIERMIENLPKVSGEIYFRFEAAKKTGLGDVDTVDGTVDDLHTRILSKVKRSGRRLRVLLIDDHPLYMTGLNAQLMRLEGLEDIECSMSASGSEAVQLARQEKPHLIICDVDMGPRSIDGYEIVRKIRAAGLESLICMHSNHKNPTEFEIAKRAGADGFLPKPMGEDSLLKLLLAALPDEAGKSQGRHASSLVPTLAEIALVDDCPFTLETWQITLQGVKTHCFGSPKDFWQHSKQDDRFLNRLACVVTDYYFDRDGETGGDFAKKLKEHNAGLPIFLASDAKVDIPAIDAYLGKLPVDWLDLDNLIRQFRQNHS